MIQGLDRSKAQYSSLDGFLQIIDDKFPPETPVIFLIDNVNLYRGKVRHDRLLKSWVLKCGISLQELHYPHV